MSGSEVLLRFLLPRETQNSFLSTSIIFHELEIAVGIWYDRGMDEVPDIDPKILDDPVFQRVLKDSLEIQDRFSAEPVFAKTGKGYLKSAGVSELKEAKERASQANF